MKRRFSRRRISPQETTVAAILAALIFLVAFNLRPALTSVGPLLPQIGADLAVNEGVLGLLGALPLLAFAAVSPFVHYPARRFGLERTLLVALFLLAVGILIRSFAGTAGLWIGTIVIGSAIAVGNVVVPTIVKRDYPRHISLATGIYSACIAVTASTASAIAVPTSLSWGWRGALALWAVPAVLVAMLWIARARTDVPLAAPSNTNLHPRGNVWTQGMAWLVAAFMGLQSLTFYFMITWLPTIETANGVPPAQAGFHLFLYQIVGIVAGLAIPRLMRRPDSQVAAAVTVTVPTLVGVAGFLLLPELGVVWAIVMGLGSGASLVVALTLMSLRGRTQHETTQLSGMAQSIGYLLAAGGPAVAGILAEATGAWHAPLIMLGIFGTLQLIVAIFVGRPPRP